VREVVLGFADAREEAAYQLSKARRLEAGDYWTEAMLTGTAVMGVVVASHVLLGVGPSARVFLCCVSTWWLLVLFPAAVHRVPAARAFYLSHRGWLWAVGLLVAGCSGVFTRFVLLTGPVYDPLNAALVSRALPFALMEFLVRPMVLRLSVPHQVLGSVGGALSTWVASFGPGDGPYTLAACLAMGAGAVAWAGVMDAPARRSWLVAQQAGKPAAAGAAGERPQPAADHGATSSRAGM